MKETHSEERMSSYFSFCLKKYSTCNKSICGLLILQSKHCWYNCILNDKGMVVHIYWHCPCYELIQYPGQTWYIKHTVSKVTKCFSKLMESRDFSPTFLGSTFQKESLIWMRKHHSKWLLMAPWYKGAKLHCQLSSQSCLKLISYT